MSLAEFLRRDAVVARIAAVSKRQALGLIAERLAQVVPGVAEDQALAGLLEREAQGSTGLGGGIAVPHARVEGITQMIGVFARLEPPVPFESVDDRPVDLLFALFAPPEAHTEHLRALARVSRAFRKPELVEKLRQAHTADALFALIATPTSATDAA